MATLEVIQSALRNFESDQTITVTFLEKGPCCGLGENFMSQVSRIVVNGYKIVNDKRVDYKKSLIAKEMLPSGGSFVSDMSKNAFQNEIIAFTKIIPSLEKTSGSKLPVPDCLHASEGLVILSDLKAEGYECLTKRNDLCVEESEVVLEKLAQLHATSIILKEEDPQTFASITSLVKDLPFEPNSILHQHQETHLDIALKVIKNLQATPKTENAIKLLQDLNGTTFAKQSELFRKRDKFSVVNHGDAWSNNLMYNQAKKDVVLIDLQLMRCTSVAADLSYFLYINLKPSLRRENYHRLLTSYLSFLKKELSQKGNLAEHFTIAWLEAEMGAFSLFGFMSSLWMLPVFYFKREDLNFADLEEPRTEDDMMARAGPEYRERLIELVFDFAENFKL